MLVRLPAALLALLTFCAVCSADDGAVQGDDGADGLHNLDRRRVRASPRISSRPALGVTYEVALDSPSAHGYDLVANRRIGAYSRWLHRAVSLEHLCSIALSGLSYSI